MSSSSGSTGTKYALFDFDDSSVEVGEVKWIRNEKLEASNFDDEVLEELMRSEEKVKVEWPQQRGRGTGPMASVTTDMWSAVLLAVSGMYITRLDTVLLGVNLSQFI